MAVQDDARELQMVALFNLVVPEDRGRSDIDAYLEWEPTSTLLPFELKSTTKSSISTVRDFGPEHIAKWRKLHWLFAFYERDGKKLRYTYYASPADMATWIEAKEAYVRPDLILAEAAPTLVTDEMLSQILGHTNDFSVDQAKLIMKKQWNAAQYRDRADLPNGRYSRDQMRELLQERLGYVIRRGATLNNPHIPESYFVEQKLLRIERDQAATLRGLVSEYLRGEDDAAELDRVTLNQASAALTDDATA